KTAALKVDIAIVDASEYAISNTATLSLRDENDAPLTPMTASDNLPTSCANVVSLDDITAENIVACVNSAATLTASYDTDVFAIDNARFVWYVDGAEIGRSAADANGSASIVYTFTQAGTVEVEIFLEGDNACFQTPGRQIEVVVEPIPTVPTITLSTNEACEGATVTLTASGSGEYKWYHEGVELLGETSNTLVLANVSTSESGSYTVRAITANGCESPVSLPAVLTVNPLPAQPTITADGSTTLCEGGQVILETPDAGAGANYAWYFDDGTGAGPQPIGENRKQLVATQSGEYTVKVLNASGCESEASLPIEVTINPAPEITITSGSLTHAVETGVSVDIPTYTEESGVTYQWYANDGTEFNGTSFGPFDAPGTYAYTLVATTDDTGCQSSVT